MRRLTLLAAFALVLAPAAAEAQPRLMLGGGISNPIGDLSDGAATGFHGRVGLQVSVPTFPVSARGDADYHRFGEGDIAGSKYNVLSGALSAVLTLPGVGISPYVLAGVGAYRIGFDVLGVSDSDTETGFHGGFGVNLGALGFGGFAEIRFINVSTESATNFRYIPVTVGIRL
jgi:opacity protein-like surface antigen